LAELPQDTREGSCTKALLSPKNLGAQGFTEAEINRMAKQNPETLFWGPQLDGEIAMRQKKLNRREFIGRSGGMVGAAGLLTQEQKSTKSQRRGGYDDSFIFERKRCTWPGGKTLALWIIPNVEVWQFDSPAGAAISPNTANRVPDVINYAWRD